MTMTVGRLIEWLSELDEDAPIIGAYQPSWPLQTTDVRVVEFDQYEEDDEEEYDDAPDVIAARAEKRASRETIANPVYIVFGDGGSGELSPYAPRSVFEN